MIKIYIKKVPYNKAVIETWMDRITINDVIASEWSKDTMSIDLKCIKDVKMALAQVYVNGEYDRVEVIEKVVMDSDSKHLAIVFEKKE